MSRRFAAQVLLRPGADGERALRAFAALGFATGALVGGNFAIEGEAALFRAQFGVTPSARPDGGVALAGAGGAASAAEGLPLSQLPASLQTLVAAVVFPEPPEFGPGGSFAGPA